MTAPMDLFTGVVPFVTVVEQGSIRGAARTLGVTPSAVSKAIRKLEARLGTRLLQRTTRRVRTTPEGDAIAACFRDAVARGLAARDVALASQRRPRGLVRVSASRVVGRAIVAPALPSLIERYPELDVDLRFTDRVVGFAEEGVDVAVRIGRLADSEAKVWRWKDTRWKTVASPTYLARRGVPDSPGALANHACLRFIAPNGRPRDWTLGEDTVHVDGPIVSDDGETLVAAAEAGAGIVQAMDFMVARAIGDGRLVEVLPALEMAGPTLWVLAAPGRARAPKIRAFVEFLCRL